MQTWSVGLIIVLCMVLTLLWANSKSDGIREDRNESASRQCGWRHPIMWGIGGASPTAPTIRGVRLSNKGKEVLMFSKIGLYLQLADATGDRVDWLEQNKESVQFYTNGIVASKGEMIDMKTPTPQSYATVSREQFVALPAETSIVIDLKAEVPIAAVRMGAVESITPPEQRRLLLETSSRYTDIADATFTAGFVRWVPATTAQVNGPVGGQPSSTIGPSGIYEYAETPTGFAPAPTPAPPPPSVSTPTLNLAGAKTRFLYAKSQGVAGSQRKVLTRYPDHVLFQVAESPAGEQRQDFLFRLTINSDQLIGASGSVVLAKCMVEEDDPGDPSIIYRDGEIYGTQQWDDRTTEFAAVTLGGTMDIAYLSDTTNQNAYLRATSTKFDKKVGAKCGMWATGSNGDGKMHFAVHKCVARAELIWSDTGLSTPASQTPCISSL